MTFAPTLWWVASIRGRHGLQFAMPSATGAPFRTGSTWGTTPIAASSSWVNRLTSGTAEQSYDCVPQPSFTLRFAIRLWITTANQVAVQSRPWSDKNPSSTRSSPSMRWPCWPGCFAMAQSPIMAASSIWGQEGPTRSGLIRSTGNRPDTSAGSIRGYAKVNQKDRVGILRSGAL